MYVDLDVVSDRAVGSVLVVVPTPIVQLFAGIRKAHEPLGVQAFRPELAVEGEKEKGTDPVDLSPTEREPIVGRSSRS